MLAIKNKEECCGCSACVNICPVQCIAMTADNEGFLYPEINKGKCICCGLCEHVCPFKIKEPIKKKKPEAYGVKAKDNDLRELSSSGGCFSLLAETILHKNGVVYGAAMTEDFKAVRHRRVFSEDHLGSLRGSKYLQSEMGETFTLVKKDLDNGKFVLFSGVPCQIDGLRLFLQKEYDNLYCVDVICHGVPSPKLWKKYAEYQEKRFNGKITAVNFRKKKINWTNFGIVVDGDRVQYYKSLDEDPYLRMFLHNVCLRPSCYNCNSKIAEAMSDITVADFWGVIGVSKTLYDDKGVSLVLTHTEKGKRLLDSILHLTKHEHVPFEEAIKQNHTYYESIDKPAARDQFYSDLDTIEFDDMIQKYASIGLKEKIVIKFRQSTLYSLYRFLRWGGGVERFDYGLFFIIIVQDDVDA